MLDPDPTPTQSTFAVILDRVQRIQQDIAAINNKMTCIDDRTERMEREQALAEANLTAKITATQSQLDAHMKIPGHEELLKRVDKLAEQLVPLILMNKIGLWFLGAFGVLVIGLLWAIFTGQVTVSFP